MVLGHYNLKELMDEKNYQDLEGGILQSLGVLINNQDRIFCYPYQEQGGEILTADKLEIPEHLKFLYKHLLENETIVDLKNPNKDILHIYSRRVLNMIQSGETEWEEMVPKEVVATIKKSCLFWYCEVNPKEK